MKCSKNQVIPANEKADNPSQIFFSMDFISTELNEYVCEHTTPESDILRELNRETHVKILQPRMLSGAFQGRFLTLIAQLVRPQKVLEIGTYTGYSALAFLEGMPENGTITTIDINEELEDFVRSFLTKANVEQRVNYLIGNALEIIPTLEMDFDLVFLDADKRNYLSYYKQLIDNLKSGAYILADNVLWSGKVVEPLDPKDIDTHEILAFNKYVQEDERVENILLPIRDGLMLIRKK